MEQRLIVITTRRAARPEERRRREAAKRRADRVWYAAAAAGMILMILRLSVLCWWTARWERGQEIDRLEQVTGGPVVQLVHMDETVSKAPEAALAPAEAGAGTRETARVREIRDCAITYFCAEKYPHICGTGDGITASGAAAVPYETCAVDPAVIPLGSTVLVDFGEGVLHTYRAEDIGGAVDGNHVDLCVASHREAETLGVMSATVYWEEG